MRKVLVLAFVAFFSLIYTNVWGATTWKKGGVKIVSNGDSLTISAIDPEGEGTRGVMPDFDDFDGSGSNKRPAAWSYGIYKIVVNEGVTTIGSYAFQNITNISTVKLPTTLTNIRTDAFKGCTGVANLYYAGSPTEWASSVTFSNLTAHPCGARTSGSDYYFFGYSSSRTDLLILEPTITEIKPYAFYRIYLHTNSVAAGLCIPGTITTIGTKAFYGATFNGEIVCNKATAPTLGTDALNTVSTGLTIYIPTGARGYTNENGWNRFSTKTQKAVSGSDIGSEISTTTDITWSLSESGVLTLNATSSTKNIESIEGASSLPWRYFRRLVHTVKLQGEITELNKMLHYNYGLGGIELDQITIPTINTTYIATNTSTAYAALFNKRDKLTLTITDPASRSHASWSNLESAPWNDAAHWKIIYPATCDYFAFWYGTTMGSEDHYECLSFVEGSTDTWLSELWTIPSANQWTYVGKPNWDVANAKSANLQLSDMPYALNHANNLGTIGTKVMEGAQGYIKICSNSSDNNKYVGFIPAGYVLRWGSANDGSWTSKVFSPASEEIEEEDWNTELHEWTSSNAMDTTFVALKTSDDYVWSNRSETRVSVFFKPNDNWLQKDAESKDCKFAMYYYTSDEAHNGWSAFMTDPDGDGIYEAWIPKDYVYTKVIFVRFPNNKASTGNWDDRYNQTGNLSLLSDKNVFTLAEGKWGTEADEGSWSLYDKKGTFHISANSNTNNWYCHFLPHHVLTYNANGGEGAPATQYVAINADPCQLTVSATEPTRTGYYFLGWSTNSEASSPDGAWDPEDTHTMTEDVTLYAVWEPAVVTFEATTNANWNTAGNWDPNFVPNINTDVILNKPVTVNTTAARAKSVVINQTTGNSGQLVVEPGQKLIVAGTIKKTTDGETYSATEANDIIINSDEANGLGALVIGSHDGTNKATVNFTTLSSGTSGSSASVAQYVGTPFKDETNILYNWYNSWVYGIAYTSNVIGWERVNEGQGMTPFKGYCVFSADGVHHNYWQQGTLVASTNQTLSGLNWKDGDAANRENLLANSWMAPIKINAMQSSDFVKTDATVYIFNAGSPDDYKNNNGASTNGTLAGQYTAYTVGTAEETDVIPAMQSFSVYTNASGGSSVTLDYSKIVYDPAVAGTVPGPNRAPRRVASNEANKLRLFVRAESGYGDMLYMWEREDFVDGFENGWDGRKVFGESVAPQLYAVTPDGKMAVNCVPEFEGTVMGFKAGDAEEYYTFTFEYSDEAQPLYLLDIQTNIYTQITSDTSYSFTTTDTDVHNRFVLTYNAPSTPTALETTPVVTTGKKVMYDNHLFILHNGRIFSAQGAMIQ